jgi:tetratricopeptide (TPR) repeat protein
VTADLAAPSIEAIATLKTGQGEDRPLRPVLLSERPFLVGMELPGIQRREVTCEFRQEAKREAKDTRMVGLRLGWSIERIVDEMVRRYPEAISYLKAYRLAHGFARAHVVQALLDCFDRDGLPSPATDTDRLAHWEHGKFPPRDSRILVYLAEIYHTHVLRLGFDITDGRVRRSPNVPAMSGAATSDRQSSRLARSPRASVSMSDVDHIERGIAACRKLDDAGQVLVAQPIIGHYRLLARSLLGTLPRAAVERRLIAALAQLYQLTGWLMFDVRRDQRAAQCYRVARQAAEESGNDGLTANILCCQSFLEINCGQFTAATESAEYAVALADRTGNVASKINALGAVGRAFGRHGEQMRAMRAIEQQDSLVTRLHPDDTPPWLYWLTSGAVASQQGACLQAIGRFQESAAYFERRLTDINETATRDRALAHIRLATARFGNSDLDGAWEELDLGIRDVATGSSKRARRDALDALVLLRSGGDTAASRQAEQVARVVLPGTAAVVRT